MPPWAGRVGDQRNMQPRGLELRLRKLDEILVLLHPSCVTVDKLFGLSVPQYPHLQNGGNNRTYPWEVCEV